jgi:hypothetical protein
MNKSFILSAALFASSLSVSAQSTPRNQLTPTPPMGWMTWNLFQGDISDKLIRETADAMVEGGYVDAGFKYIFIDDLWQGGRDVHNNMIPDPKKFPNGIKALADYVHSKGMKLGIYSDAAQLTCGGWTASLGFEEQDARTFASWGIDYLKYDYSSTTCHTNYSAYITAMRTTDNTTNGRTQYRTERAASIGTRSSSCSATACNKSHTHYNNRILLHNSSVLYCKDIVF